MNTWMIRHFCEAIGDWDPVYTDDEAARRSPHGAIVAPPAMLTAWCHIDRRFAKADEADPVEELFTFLHEHGYTSSIGTGIVQEYARYLRLGDQIARQTSIGAISDEKVTRVGRGFFTTLLATFTDANDEVVGRTWITNLRFRPRQQKG